MGGTDKKFHCFASRKKIAQHPVTSINLFLLTMTLEIAFPRVLIILKNQKTRSSGYATCFADLSLRFQGKIAQHPVTSIINIFLTTAILELFSSFIILFNWGKKISKILMFQFFFHY